MRTPERIRMPPTPGRPVMIDILEGLLLGIYLAFMMGGGAFLGALLMEAFTKWAADRKIAREDLNQ